MDLGAAIATCCEDVERIASRYAAANGRTKDGRTTEQALSRGDLVSVGSIAVLEAAQTFDDARGASFRTYAYGEAERAIRKSAAAWRGAKILIPNSQTLEPVWAQHAPYADGGGVARSESPEYGWGRWEPETAQLRTNRRARRENYFLHTPTHFRLFGPPKPAAYIRKPFPPRPFVLMRKRYDGKSHLHDALRTLSDRQHEFMREWREFGWCDPRAPEYRSEPINGEIARALGISEGRVSTIRAAVLLKLEGALRPIIERAQMRGSG